jgi:mRNA interferase MazF
LVQLNPTKGKEINKPRPCVIISPDEMIALSTVLVAPMTTKGFAFPCRIECEFKLILLDHIRALDILFLEKKSGMVDEDFQLDLCSSLQELFAF